MKIIGLMSGTSMDGLDCCYVDLKVSENYQFKFNVINTKTIEYDIVLKNKIKDVIKNQDVESISNLDNELGKFYLDCVNIFIGEQPVDLISLHGQTILHEDGVKTKQIGSPKFLSKFYNIPVVYDFRTLDIALGGKGAPLIPFLDWLIYKNSNIDTITLNLGGIANITYIPKNSSSRNNVRGFDTGPAMCLIDQYMSLTFNQEMDFNAEISMRGNVNKKLLDNLMKNQFINEEPPKSTSVQKFNIEYLNKIINSFKDISNEDLIRTLVNYTAVSINYNINKFLKIKGPYNLIVSGGGANHPLLMKDLKNILEPYKIEKFNINQVNHNFKESLLMAVMGYTFYFKIPNNMINVTGANKDAVYGVLYE